MSYRRRARAFLRRHLGIAAPLLALAVVSTALVLVANGSAIVGCGVLLLAIPSTWLGGLWVAPNSVDTYSRRMAHLLRDEVAQAAQENRRQIKRIQAMTATVAELDPPEQLRGLHARVLGILREIDSIKRDDPEMLVDRTVRVFGLRRQLCQIREELGEYPVEPYLVTLADVLDRRMIVTSETAEAVQRPLRRQNEALKRVKIPRAWLSRHNAYVEQLTSYLAALEEYYRTVTGDSAAEAEMAARILRTKQRQVKELVDEYFVAFHTYHSGDR
ncbi:MAG TPA: hypothetical protein VHS55_03110 [Solirubrobacteraceae bacterium]|nr:hypothetical protein [Solirubrobacteraceae bacterium]